MSWQASDYVRQLRGVTAIEKAVLYSLADRHNTTDGGCWPRVALIAEEAGLSVRRTHDNLKRLVDKGIIRIEERLREDGSQASNFYAFTALDPDERSGMTRRHPAGRSVRGGLTERQTLEPIREPEREDDQEAKADQVINSCPENDYRQILEHYDLLSGIYSTRYWKKFNEPLPITSMPDFDRAVRMILHLEADKKQRLPGPSWLPKLEKVGKAIEGQRGVSGPAFYALRRLKQEQETSTLMGGSNLELVAQFSDRFLELLDQEIQSSPGR